MMSRIGFMLRVTVSCLAAWIVLYGESAYAQEPSEAFSKALKTYVEQLDPNKLEDCLPLIRTEVIVLLRKYYEPNSSIRADVMEKITAHKRSCHANKSLLRMSLEQYNQLTQSFKFWHQREGWHLKEGWDKEVRP